MFNFDELEIINKDEPGCPRGSFVGIRKDKYLGKMAFILPKGFENFEKDYDSIKNLFFKMYRTFNQFYKNNQAKLDINAQSKDNAKKEYGKGVYIFSDEEDNQVILYSKIDIIENVFRLYKNLEIESLTQELGTVDNIDYSKIENHLDKGVYLPNNAIYIENIDGYRNIVKGIPSELIEIYCYIYTELAWELENEISSTLREISSNFSYKYLTNEQRLFNEFTFNSTIKVLKDCLDNIHRKTSYKNSQYWDIYEVVENFLYGSLTFSGEDEQGFWGTEQFSYIWEDMCNYMIYKDQSNRILYCDTQIPLGEKHSNLIKNRKVWIDKNMDDNFYIELHGYQRWMRPDVILESLIRDNHLETALNMGYIIINIQKLPFSRANIDIIFKSNIDGIEIEKFRVVYEVLKRRFFGLHKSRINLKKLQGYQPRKMGKNSFSLINIPMGVYSQIIDETKNIKTIRESDYTYIIDWKYYNEYLFDKNPLDGFLQKSIIKQLAYELCLSEKLQNNHKIKNQFGIPGYLKESQDIILNASKLNCGIEIIRLNFSLIQEIYLNE